MTNEQLRKNVFNVITLDGLKLAYEAHLSSPTITRAQVLEFHESVQIAIQSFMKTFDYNIAEETFSQPDDYEAKLPFIFWSGPFPDYQNAQGGLDLLDGKKIRYRLANGQEVQQKELKKGDVLTNGTKVLSVCASGVVSISKKEVENDAK